LTLKTQVFIPHHIINMVNPHLRLCVEGVG